MKIKIIVVCLLIIAAILLIAGCTGINNPFHVATEEEWLEADERGHLPFGAAEKEAEEAETLGCVDDSKEVK